MRQRWMDRSARSPTRPPPRGRRPATYPSRRRDWRSPRFHSPNASDRRCILDRVEMATSDELRDNGWTGRAGRSPTRTTRGRGPVTYPSRRRDWRSPRFHSPRTHPTGVAFTTHDTCKSRGPRHRSRPPYQAYKRDRTRRRPTLNTKPVSSWCAPLRIPISTNVRSTLEREAFSGGISHSLPTFKVQRSNARPSRAGSSRSGPSRRDNAGRVYCSLARRVSRLAAP